jgi:hypothetical protein
MAKKNTKGAIKAFHKALTKCPNVRTSHLHEVAHDFAAVIDYCGYPAHARLTLGKLNRSSCSSKEFVIILDGSLRKEPNSLADKVFAKVLELYDIHITADDIISSFTFSNEVHRLVSRGMKGNGEDAREKRNALIDADLQDSGPCACYDGIWEALATVQSHTSLKENEEDKMILCVVDSEDKGSQHLPRELISRFRSSSKIKLIVVALKELPNLGDLQGIAECNGKGTLVRAFDGIEGLDNALGGSFSTLPRMPLHLEGI